jgi:phosphoribosylformylglycinamidine synthase
MAFRARVVVTPRADVLDPQGQAVESALRALGFDEASGVRVGRFVEVELAGEDQGQAEARLTEMCEKLLANLVVEDFTFEMEPAE